MGLPMKLRAMSVLAVIVGCWALFVAPALAQQPNPFQSAPGPQTAPKPTPRPRVARPPADEDELSPTATPPATGSGRIGCVPDATLSSDGYCVAAGETYCGNGKVCRNGLACRQGDRCAYASGCYPDQVHIGNTCMPAGAVSCGNNRYCDPGQVCTSDGGCRGGSPNTGPVCSNGKRAQAGWICMPDGGSYNPQTQKICGTAVCDIRDECGPTNNCLSGLRQTPAARPGAR